MLRCRSWVVGFLTLVAANGVRAAETRPRTPDGGASCITQFFDEVTAPALPFRWSAVNGAGSPPLWVTDTNSPDTTPNDVFIPVPAAVSDKWLLTPPIPIMSASAQFTFRHSYSFTSGVDGGVLEVSTDGGATFRDVNDPKFTGRFITGGYDTTIASADNPLSGRLAWSGDSGGYKTTTLELFGGVSSSVPGHNAIFRWRMGSSASSTGGFWRVDSLTISEPCTLPAYLYVDIHSTTNTPEATPLNGVFEPAEIVVVEPGYHNAGTSNVVLTGNGLFGGPLGATYSMPDSAADYGTVVPGEVIDCYNATDNCYIVSVDQPAIRPAPHWDATLTEDLSSEGFWYWTLHIGSSFGDEPSDNPFYPFVENIFHNGVTGGCGGGNYCPGNSVTRGQMAVFLLKAAHGNLFVPPACTGVFPDVPCPSQFADWIEEFFHEGITGGCGGGNYCPNNPVRRDQMSALLLKAQHGSSYVPPACTGVFLDVPCPSQFADWIEQLSAEQITSGCGGGNYCPSTPNTRAQMAVFLVKTFDLLLYGP